MDFGAITYGLLPLIAIPLLYYHQQNEHGSHENLRVVPEMLSCNIYIISFTHFVKLISV